MADVGLKSRNESYNQKDFLHSSFFCKQKKSENHFSWFVLKNDIFLFCCDVAGGKFEVMEGADFAKCGHLNGGASNVFSGAMMLLPLLLLQFLV